MLIKKTKWILGLILFVFLPVTVFILAEDSTRNIDESLFDENGNVLVSELRKINKDLSNDVVNEALLRSPDLLSYLYDFSFNSNKSFQTNKNDDIELLISIRELVWNLFREKNNYLVNREFLLNLINDEDILRKMKLHYYHLNSLKSLDRKEIAKSILALYILVLAPNSNRIFETADLVSLYSEIKKIKLPNNIATKGVLNAIWLNVLIENTDTNKETALLDLNQLVSPILTEGDLIRNLSSNKVQSVIATANVIERLAPLNAIHALRYHLVKQYDENISIALLSAISVYGTEARTYEAQFKKLLVNSNSTLVKLKIQETLKLLNGNEKPLMRNYEK